MCLLPRATLHSDSEQLLFEEGKNVLSYIKVTFQSNFATLNTSGIVLYCTQKSQATSALRIGPLVTCTYMKCVSEPLVHNGVGPMYTELCAHLYTEESVYLYID